MSRCCQSGVRWPGRRRGIRSARAGVLAEPRAEERRRADLLDDQILELLRLDEQIGERGRRVGVREVERDPVVGPERLHLRTERVAQPRRQRHRPRRVHPPTERRQDADPPVADLVTEALHDDRPVCRQRGAALLLSQEREEIPRGERVEVVLAAQPVAGALVGERGQLARCRADPRAQLVRPPHALALPERHRTRHARRRRDEHLVARDLLDAPGRGPEHEGLALARLVDHLLVELADAAAAADLEDAEEAAVGDRARVRHREPARARCDRGSRRRCGPRRCAAGAPRTRRTDTARQACRGRSRVARAPAPRTGRRRGRAGAGRRPRSPPRRRSRRSAGRARRAGSAGSRSPRWRPPASPSRRRRTRAGRRGTSGRSDPSTSRRARGRPGPPAGGRAPPTSGSPPG